ncbi:MAG TPA: CBS domain-containing protein [Pyrinomonadaceae bacterium]|nr:CBS domain-containing protein [Pyrinomonadaceae bacterium]
MNVSEIMTADPACCTPDTALKSVAQMMIDNDCGCIPVVENEQSGKPVGVVTDRDIVIRSLAEGKNPLDLTASDVMTRSVVTVTPDISVADCCGLMEDQQIRRITVVDEKGSCCGIVAQADIAKNADQKRTAEVVQEVSRATA